jgi:4-hydroxybenzoate polyprenyltransferase
MFALGAFVMRGAGCAYNDIVDRDIDAKVARTAQRPIPAGHISIRSAWIFLVSLCLAGLVVLTRFNAHTIALGVGSLALVAAYPFMKRITWWPQAFLGITFNWGALLGWSAAVGGGIAWTATFLYLGGIAWTLFYDTIYAHQDKEDDALVGVKSTARLFGDNSARWLVGFAVIAMIFWSLAVAASDTGWLAWPMLLLVAGHFVLQIRGLDLDDPAACLRCFRSNRNLGLLLFLAILAGQLVA